MHHSHLRLHLIGLSDEARRIIEGTPPLEAFSHTFTVADRPDKDAAAKASGIFFDASRAEECGGTDAAADVRLLVEAKSERASLIIFCRHDQADELVPLIDNHCDLWIVPLDEAELRFRFANWQRLCKLAIDCWRTDQYLETTINSIPNLVWYKSKDGVHQKVNDSFCHAVNKTHEQVEGQRHAYIWNVEREDPACIESERLVMETEQTHVTEEIIQTGDGERVLTTYKSPLYGLDGEVVGTVGVGIDVTNEHAYEKSLIEKNRALETIFTTMDCGVITHSTDGSRILGINQAALRILGYATAQDLIDDGFAMAAKSVIEEDRIRLIELMRTLTKVGDSVNTEYRVQHPDGTILHVTGNVKLIEQDGELMYQRYLLDTTAQKKEAERQELRRKELVQTLSEDYLLACTFDLDTGLGELLRIEAGNGVHKIDLLFDEDPHLDTVMDAYIEQSVHEDDRAMMHRALSLENLLWELEKKERFHVMYRAEGDGAEEYCQATAVRTGTDAESRNIVLGFRNVDQQTREELKEALARANRANAAKSAFLSNMSHDIRTPMNAIVGFTALASNHIEDTNVVQEYLEKIQTSSTHLLSLINDILDMSRIESGKVALDEKPHNLKTIFHNIDGIFQVEASAKGLNLVVDTEGIAHTAVYCDRLRLNQIVLNLLSNAVKFTESGGTITVTVQEGPGVEEDCGCYRITVADTGIGMSEDFVRRIFDPFERERTSTISGIQGTGLGMSITKNLVDIMHGTIDVKSAQGVGTEITVELPLRLADEASASMEATGAAPHMNPSRNLKGSRILLVDDNDLNREIALTLLEDEGFVVEYAVNGQEAVEKLVAAGPDHFKLVLMDVQMPIMNGYEATRIIRGLNDERLSSIPILAMTADAFEEDRQKALRSGMDGHLSKPLEIDKLFAVLDATLA